MSVGVSSRAGGPVRVSVRPGGSVSFTAIPPGTCPISSDLGSQARSGPVSTWMGDRLGIPGAVSLLLELVGGEGMEKVW